MASDDSLREWLEEMSQKYSEMAGPDVGTTTSESEGKSEEGEGSEEEGSEEKKPSGKPQTSLASAGAIFKSQPQVEVVAASAPGGGGEKAGPVSVINTALESWDIIKGEKLSTASSYCNALPNGVDATQLSGWKKVVIPWKWKETTLLGFDFVDIDFRVVYLSGGTSSSTKGWWVNGFSVYAKKLWTDPLVTVDVKANVSSSPYNSGDEDWPIGAVALQVQITLDPTFGSKESWGYEYTAFGNGAMTPTN